jgi:hypothetical protein
MKSESPKKKGRHLEGYGWVSCHRARSEKDTFIE